AVKVITILSSMEHAGLNLLLLLDLLSWGDQECVVSVKIRYEHTALMVSEELPGIMEYWRSPPQATGSMDVHAKAAQPVVEEFSFSCIADIIEKELQGIQELSICPSDEVSDSGLTCFLIEDMVLKLST
ncbi:hypothetical protein PAXRUDRAFT_791231, partial [Paxillus rubicundulus Ve08.2h10]